MTDADSDTTTYRLQEDVDRVVRSGLVLEGDETVELDPAEAREHDDVLEPVDGTTDDSSSDGQDQEASDE